MLKKNYNPVECHIGENDKSSKPIGVNQISNFIRHFSVIWPSGNEWMVSEPWDIDDDSVDTSRTVHSIKITCESFQIFFIVE